MTAGEVLLLGIALIAGGSIALGWNAARRVTRYMLGGKLK